MSNAIRFRVAVVVSFLVAGLASAETSTTPTQGIRSETPRLTAFTHAIILVSPGKTIEDGTLIVRDGRVVAAGNGLAIPKGAVELDLGGRRIYPGFIDPYTDYGLGHLERPSERGRDGGPKYEGTRVAGNAWNDAIHAEQNWIESFKPDSKAAKSLMNRGVTIVQSARMDGVFRGRSFVTSLREALPNDTVIQPYGLHFASFDKGSSQQEYPSSLMGSIALVRQTVLDAEWYRRAHAAWKANPAQEMPEFNSAVEALAANGGPVVFETGDPLSLIRAGRISREMNIPFILVGSDLEYEHIEEIAALRQPLILPLTFPEMPGVKTAEDALDVSLSDLRRWERSPSNPAVLSQHGVRFAFTGKGLREKEDFFANLRKAIKRGLAPETALAALTTVPAELTGIGSLAGTLEPGRLANFSIVDGDLLADDDAKILSVWIDGERIEEIQPLEVIDLRGRYEIATAAQTWQIELTGEPEKLEGEIRSGELKTELKDVSLNRNQLTFNVNLGSLGAAGVARISMIHINDALTGQVHMPDGSITDIVARPLGEAELSEVEAAEEIAEGGPAEEVGTEAGEEEVDTPAEEEEKEEILVSRVTYPNAAFGSGQIAARENVIVRHATIWTSDDQGVIEDGDLLVIDGKIAGVGRGLTVPAGAREIDGTGRHVTPGIIDEHSHLAISRGVNEGSHAATAEVRIGDVVDPDDVGIYRALAGGVTAAQLLHGSANPIGGQAQVVKMRWGRSSEELKFAEAPPSIKFALGENVKQSNWGDDNTIRYPQTRMGVETFIRDRFIAAREYGEAWREYEGLPKKEKDRTIPPRRDLQLETLLEILEGKRFVHAHSYVQSEILMLIRLAEELGFRIQTFTHILEGYKVAPEMARHGSGGSTFADWWAYKFEVYDAIPQNPCLMQKHGVVTSINSDSDEMMRRLNQEAGKSIMYCGMDEVEALRMVTINPAKQLRVDGRTGSLARGKDADFVIWNGHPLSMYSRPDETWVDGTPYFTIERDLALRAGSRQERQALIQKVLESPDNGEDSKKGRSERKQWNCDDVEDVWHATNTH